MTRAVRVWGNLLLVAVALSSSWTWAQEQQAGGDAGPRIGFVDLRRVLQESPQGRAVAAEIQKETDGYDREAQRQQQEVERLAALMQSIPAGDPDLEKYKKQCEEAKGSLSRTAAARLLALENMNARLRPPCYRQVQEAVAAVAGAQGIVAVLNRKSLPRPEQGMDIWNYELESQTVLFSETGLDLTDAVLAEMGRRALSPSADLAASPPPQAAPPPQEPPPADTDRSRFGRPSTKAQTAPAAPANSTAAGPGQEDPDAYRARLKAELKAEILAELGRAPAAQGPSPSLGAATPALGENPARSIGRIEGIVVHDGAGVPGCQIKAIQVIEKSGFLGGTVLEQGKEFVVTTGADGKYVFDRVPTGKYFLKWLAPGSPSWVRRVREEADVEVLSGQTSTAKQIDLGHAVIGD